MTIEITNPELESLIQQRLKSGPFTDPQDVLLDAMQHSPEDTRTGADLIAAIQASPYREVDLVVERGPMPVRELSL